MNRPPDPAAMSTSDRMREIAQLLAIGLRRLFSKRATCTEFDTEIPSATDTEPRHTTKEHYHAR